MILMCCNANGESQPTIKQQDYKKNDKVDCMNYYAHTKDNEPKNKWQRLSEHLHNTAQIAECFTNIAEYKDIFRIAALLHDLGKYQPAFQNYLEMGGRRGSVPHASWGAGYAHILGLNEISITIDGHHKGLPDRANWKNDVMPYHKGEVDNFSEVVNSFLLDTGIDESIFKIELPVFNDIQKRELFTRYLHSTLTDADWLDTEKHCSPELSEKRIKRILDYDEFERKLEAAISDKPKDGELNRLRNEVREFSLSKAKMPTGFYSMNLPTGMGKTLASVAWALKHARENSLKRIIIVLPFINIIDQTSTTLKEIFGEESILEHHSGIGDDLSISENPNDNQYGRRLACENWDFPIIVTTTVQFFESIFSNKTSKCRKIHNIAESVVIFDEVQSLPKQIIEPTLTMLDNMQSVMNTSFLFCTATLPAFEKRERFEGIDSITPLVKNASELFDKSRRVSYHHVNNFEPVDLNELVSVAESRDCAVLAVFNTKKSAREFFVNVSETDVWTKRYHLSTAMCPVHRKEIIKEIRQDLEDKKKILVSSTQLIEAGVDFDFPCVMREIAPLESIIQSAGRCNRENKLNTYGIVFLFRLIDSGMPDKQYRTASEYALELIKDNPANLYKHDFYEEYYRKFVGLFVNADKMNINKARENFDFATVSNSYRIIDKPTKGLFIYNYNDSSKELLETISNKKFLSRDDYRKMQVYIVQVYENFIFHNKNSIAETSNGVAVWYGGYDKKTGISVDPIQSDTHVV